MFFMGFLAGSIFGIIAISVVMVGVILMVGV